MPSYLVDMVSANEIRIGSDILAFREIAQSHEIFIRIRVDSCYSLP